MHLRARGRSVRNDRTRRSDGERRRRRSHLDAAMGIRRSRQPDGCGRGPRRRRLRGRPDDRGRLRRRGTFGSLLGPLLGNEQDVFVRRICEL
ncbi:MAG: hypothetical protein D6705_10235 [Deltaproteobacteria bacterium]|nr:MAG: hypothetical protein D6705_10235 [Deltaproteobacteria bacterium]